MGSENIVKKKTRIETYENMRFFLMFLVVLGHCLEFNYSSDMTSMRIMFLGIYFFHMPAFIFLSGLMNNIERKPNYERSLNYIILGYIYKMLNCIVVGVGTGDWKFSLIKENGIPWFLFVLAIYPIIAHLVRNVKPGFMVAFSVLLGCFAGFDESVTDGIMVVGRLAVFFPFYLIGCYMNPQKLLEFCKKKAAKVISVTVLLGYAGCLVVGIDKLYKLRHIVTGKNVYSDGAMIHGHMLLRLGCYMVALVIIIALISVIPNRKLPIVTAGGGRTLAIYFWHHNILRILKYAGVTTSLIELSGLGIWFAPIFAGLLTCVLTWEKFSIPIDYLTKGIYVKRS